MQLYIYGGNNSDRQNTNESTKPETPEIKQEISVPAPIAVV